jgi:diadenosine tetraphosphate (Ap4A) HIT family hydrolase
VLKMMQEGIEVVGIDSSPAMLGEARNRVPNGVFRKMDIARLRFPPETFAGIWACASFQELPAAELPSVLAGCARVLIGKGVLMAAVPLGDGEGLDGLGRHRKCYPRQEFHARIAESGFEILEEKSTVNEKHTDGRVVPKRWLQLLTKKRQMGPQIEQPNCPFCSGSRFQLNRQIGLKASSAILWGSDDVYAIPDIAPLADGHLLLATTRHLPCWGAHPNPDLISAEKQRVRRLFRTAFDRPTVFLEHGPACEKGAGACIDHAHLHCLPCVPSLQCLRQEVERYLGPGELATQRGIQQLYREGRSYLFLEEGTGEGWVFPRPSAPRQLFRQILASMLSVSTWQWGERCRQPEARSVYHRTVDRLSRIVDEAWEDLDRES